MIRLDDLKRQFGGRVLFEHLSWLIPRGARLGLVGQNGSGKTTLLRILDGREAPDAGSVARPQSLRVGYLPQEVETVGRGSVLAIVLGGFAEVAALEREIEAVEGELARSASEDARAARLTERYGALRQRWEQLEGHRLEARARSFLSGLGVPERSFHEPIEALSGGWRMRVALARLLLGGPDLLLLDEPTNHLDLDALGWLEEFLAAFEGSFIVVSHDRYFLNRMVDGIVELERGVLTPWAGNYDTYLEQKQVRAEATERAAKQQAREVAKVERFIERFRYKNTKARQVQSRIRALDKLERIRVERSSRRIRFGFPQAPRSGDVVLRAEGVVKRYDDRVVYAGLDLVLRRGDRVALAGPNGSGKSTLLKLIARRVAPDAGRLELGHNVHACYYAQHQLDDLDPGRSVLDELGRAAPGQEPGRLRSLLGCFLFSGDDVDKRVAVLSGGEKARLALTKLLVQPSNLLLLDEPTNHLDLRSREVLEDALNEYAGTLVVVSHDRYLINRVATAVGEIVDGRLVIVPGDYDEFVEWQRRRAAERPATPVETSSSAAPRRDRREDRRREADERNRLYRARRAVTERLAPLEDEIARLEARLRDLDVAQTEPRVYRDPAQAAAVGRERSEAATALDALYAEWERRAAELEAD